jgi:hypothetical protein
VAESKKERGVRYIEELEHPESEYALTMIPHEEEEDRLKLETAYRYMQDDLDSQKWVRAMGWFQNHSFAAGNHYPNYRFTGSAMVFDPGIANPNPSGNMSGRISQPMIPKTSDDKLIRPLESSISQMTEQRPYPRVTPNSDRPEDQDAAILSEIVLDLYWEHPLRLPARLRSIGAILCLQGTASLEIQYEETDQSIFVPEYEEVDEEDPIAQETYKSRRPTGQDVPMFRRDLKAKVFDSFQLQPNPSATDDPETLLWMTRSSYEDIGWIKLMFDRDEKGFYPENLDRINPEYSSQSPLYWRERVRDLIEMPESSYALTGKKYAASEGVTPNQARFSVADVRPSIAFPQGRTQVYAGGVLLYCGKARAYNERYPWRWHPHSIFRHWGQPGRFWGVPLFSKLVPLQRRINAIDALVQINRQYMVLGQWLIPKQSRVPDGAMSGNPGAEIRYNASTTGAKPERMEHKPLPQELLAERDMCERSIELIAGTAGMLGNEMGSGMRAASMLDILKKNAMAAKTNFFQGLEESIESVGQNILIEVSVNVAEADEQMTNRIRAAAREHSLAAIKSFVGRDLRDNVFVKIDIASRLLRTIEAEREQLLQWFQFKQGQLDPTEASVFVEKMGWSEFSKKDGPDYRRARKMVSRISDGDLAAFRPIDGLDNPTIFMEVFREELLSDRVNDYPEPVVAKLFEAFDAYSQMAAQQAAAQQQNQIALTSQMARAEKGVFPGKPTSAELEGGSGNDPRANPPKLRGQESDDDGDEGKPKKKKSE